MDPIGLLVDLPTDHQPTGRGTLPTAVGIRLSRHFHCRSCRLHRAAIRACNWAAGWCWLIGSLRCHWLGWFLQLGRKKHERHNGKSTNLEQISLEVKVNNPWKVYQKPNRKGKHLPVPPWLSGASCWTSRVLFGFCWDLPEDFPISHFPTAQNGLNEKDEKDDGGFGLWKSPDTLFSF